MNQNALAFLWQVSRGPLVISPFLGAASCLGEDHAWLTSARDAGSMALHVIHTVCATVLLVFQQCFVPRILERCVWLLLFDETFEMIFEICVCGLSVQCWRVGAVW